MQTYFIDFVAANRRFDCLEILLVYNESDKHTATIYNSYSLERTSTFIKDVSIGNVTNTYVLLTN